MKPPVLLSLLRNLSYAGCLVIVTLALLLIYQGWIAPPIAAHSPGSYHGGIGLGKFDIFVHADGVDYRGVRNDNIFFSGGEITLNVGQAGTPPALLSLLHWKVASVSVLLLLPATILWLFGRLFGAVKKGESFSLQSVRRIQMMGWCFVALFGLETIFSYVFFYQLAVGFASPQTGAGYVVHPQNPSLDLRPIFFALFAFALAEVFRQGLLLKQENDLTV